MGTKVCPKCGSENVSLVTGGLGGVWECKGCKYSNDIFPERDAIVSPEVKNDTK